MVDTLIQKKRRTHRSLCSYYTESAAIVDFMTSLLKADEGDRVLEPCAGDGAFIDALLKSSIGCEVPQIDAIEIGTEALDILGNKYRSNPRVQVRKADTLLDLSLDELASKGGF